MAARHPRSLAYFGGMRTALIALAFVALAAPAAAETLPSFPKRTLYSDARASLQALDWQPARTPAGAVSRCAPGREDVCDLYPETLTCQGTGLARCTFLWRKGGRLIEVGTVGEDAAEIVVDRTICRVGC